MPLGDEQARSRPHVIPRHAGLGGDPPVVNVVDCRDHRFQGGNPFNLWRQPLIGHGPQDHRIEICAVTSPQLLQLARKVRVSASLEHIEGHTQTPCLFDHPEIDRQPIGILQMGIKHAKPPRTCRPVQRHIGQWHRSTAVVEGHSPRVKLPNLRACRLLRRC